MAEGQLTASWRTRMVRQMAHGDGVFRVLTLVFALVVVGLVVAVGVVT